MKHLRQALWQLISFLDKGFGGLGSRMLCVDQHWVHMNGLPDVWVDLTQFERAYATIHSLPIQHWDPQELGVINNALSLYVGELLEGCYEDWCLLERQRLHDMHLVMLDKLVEYCEQQQDLEGVLEYAARILRFDATHEQAHWHLMRALYLRGDRTAALRQYERCVNRLKTEFGADPSKKIRALYRQICADELDTPYQVYRLDSYSSPLPLPLAL
jgi:DNA-binding SARP family transcriptional activator